MTENVCVFGDTFLPPGSHHREIAKALIERYGRVVVVPCGLRQEKTHTRRISSKDRRKLVELGFAGIPGLEFEFFDLWTEPAMFSPTWKLDIRFHALNPTSEIIHTFGYDLIKGGAKGESEIQRLWKKGSELWQRLDMVIVISEEERGSVSVDDLPPHAELLVAPTGLVHSSDLRRMIEVGDPRIEQYVQPLVLDYINAHGLFKQEAHANLCK